MRGPDKGMEAWRGESQARRGRSCNTRKAWARRVEERPSKARGGDERPSKVRAGQVEEAGRGVVRRLR